jgi:hypothetical protein
MSDKGQDNDASNVPSQDIAANGAAAAGGPQVLRIDRHYPEN